MRRWWCALWLLVSPAAAIAADLPLYEPQPDWVRPPPAEAAKSDAADAGVQLIFADTEARFGHDEDANFAESRFRLTTAASLNAAANLTMTWRPDTETLVIHRMTVRRGDRVIDLLDGGRKVTVLRREQNLEAAALDGALTATVQPEGLQVGDEIDWAFSIRRKDPVLEGRSEIGEAIFGGAGPGVRQVRALWPKSKAMAWRVGEGLPRPQLSETGGLNELLLRLPVAQAPRAPVEAPARFADVGLIEFSDFHTWSEVSALMAARFAKAETLSDTSPLKTEIARIKASSPDPKARAEAALRLVQDQIRYQLLAMNLGGYIPADADVTWTRRFGDCKAKTALLLALLHGLGIEASPVLVSQHFGDGLDKTLPRLDDFDHVLARASINGKTYWLDGTRIGDRDLDSIETPDLHWVLPVLVKSGGLVDVRARPPLEPLIERITSLDASAGYDAPAPAHVEMIFRGDLGVATNLGLVAVGQAEAERNLREYWRSDTPWIEVKTIRYIYNDDRRVLRVIIDGSAKIDWARAENGRDFQVQESHLGFETSFARDPGPWADAPFVVHYPFYERHEVSVVLPGHGRNFVLLNAEPLNQVIASRRMLRRGSIGPDGVARIETEQINQASETTAADGRAAQAELGRLNSHDVLIRGPETVTLIAAPSKPAPPTDASPGQGSVAEADRLAHEAADLIDNGQLHEAITRLDQAIKLAPDQGRYRYDRGVAQQKAGRSDLALADFTIAARLDPKDVLAWEWSGRITLGRGDVATAKADFDQALKAAGAAADVAMRLSEAYDGAGQRQAAVEILDTVQPPTDDRLKARLLNARCWARARWGQQLPQALANCDAALALLPASVNILDSRALVRLRSGEFEAAIADYQAILVRRPAQAGALYGKALAEAHLGRAGEAQADRSRALAAQAGVAASFDEIGLVFPVSDGR